MKNEILRINNLNMEYSTTVQLNDISLCLLEGECIGLLGLGNSGKSLLVELICGSQKLYSTGLYMEGKKYINSEDWQKYVYKLSVFNYLIDDWTVAEYIYLVDNSIFGILNRKKLLSKTRELLNKYQLNIDPDKKLKELTELEKRLIDLVKASSKRVRIIVIEDEFEGCSTQDIKQFKELLNKVIRDGMAAVINSHSDNVLHTLSDKFIIFKKGYIVKKCRNSFTENYDYLESFILSESTISKKKDLDNYKIEQSTLREVVYSLDNIDLREGKKLHFDFCKGEVVTILALDVKEKEKIFEFLSGRLTSKDINILLNGRVCRLKDSIDFVKNRIASVADMGGESELLLSMSAGNNLLIPSLKKLTPLQHIFTQRKVIKMLEKELKDNLPVKHENVKNMSVNDYIILLLERWYIYKPKVLVLFEPFIHCDMFGVSLVRSYIKKFTDIGTAVIIIKSREEYVEYISDRIICI